MLFSVFFKPSGASRRLQDLWKRNHFEVFFYFSANKERHVRRERMMCWDKCLSCWLRSRTPRTARGPAAVPSFANYSDAALKGHVFSLFGRTVGLHVYHFWFFAKPEEFSMVLERLERIFRPRKVRRTIYKGPQTLRIWLVFMQFYTQINKR